MEKYTDQAKLAAVKDYCSGEAGLKAVAQQHGVYLASTTPAADKNKLSEDRVRMAVSVQNMYRQLSVQPVRRRTQSVVSVRLRWLVRPRRTRPLAWRSKAMLSDLGLPSTRTMDRRGK
jgi:transposase-like protein